MDVRLALRLTIGDPEVVGAFANCLFQFWHRILLANRAPGPAKVLPRKVNELLRGRPKPEMTTEINQRRTTYFDRATQTLRPRRHLPRGQSVDDGIAR